MRDFRAKRGWSARALADHLTEIGFPQLNRSALASIESGRRSYVTVDELFALAVALDVSLLDLLLPDPYEPDATLEVVGKGTMSAGAAWEWASGAAPALLRLRKLVYDLALLVAGEGVIDDGLIEQAINSGQLTPDQVEAIVRVYRATAPRRKAQMEEMRKAFDGEGTDS